MIQRRLTLALIVFFCALGTVSAQAKDWTFLVYLEGNNNLEDAGLSDLKEMIASESPTANIVIYADRGQNYTPDGVPGAAPWTGVKKFIVQGGKLKELANVGVIDATDPKYLTEFVSWGLKTYPAKKTALILWDHGGGWEGYASSDVNPEGILRPPVIRDAVAAGLKAAGVKKFDILGFDACLMANFETVSILKDLASYYVASEETEPGHGWDYSKLKPVFDKQGDAVALGKAIVDGYNGQAKAAGDQNQITLSFLDLSKFGAVESAVTAFVNAAQGRIRDVAPTFGKTAGSVLRFGKAAEPSRDLHLVDLGAFVDQVSKGDSTLATPAKNVNTALKQLVIAKAEGSQNKGSTGLTAYFPDRSSLYSSNYDSIGQKDWQKLIKGYYDAGKVAAQGTAFGFVGDPKLKKTKDGFTVSAALKPGSAAIAISYDFTYGYRDEDALIFLGAQDAFPSDDGKTVSSDWDGKYLNIIQGDNDAMVYADWFLNEDDTSTVSIPFAYFDDGKVNEDEYDYLELDITVDAEGEILDKTWYMEAENGNYSEFKPKKGSKIVPIVAVFYDDEEEAIWELTADTGFNPLKDFDYEWRDYESGDSVFVQLNAYDVGDNYESTEIETTLP